MQRIAAAASVCEEGGNGQKNEKALEPCSSRALRLVRLAGIEPTTPWFVVNTNCVPKETTASEVFILFIKNQQLTKL
jgi:hypothetical protein